MDLSTIVHLFHIIFVGGLFLYVGIMRTMIPTILYPFLLALGIFIIFYHLFKTYKKVMLDKNPWINIIHVLIIGPILIYIGINKEKTQRFVFEILLMLGFASIGYHAYYLFSE